MHDPGSRPLRIGPTLALGCRLSPCRCRGRGCGCGGWVAAALFASENYNSDVIALPLDIAIAFHSSHSCRR
eukprot:3857125-Prymnesium_polylepis.1